MGLIGRQLNDRTKYDKTMYEDSLMNLAGIIMHPEDLRRLHTDRFLLKNSLLEILNYYHEYTSDISADDADTTEHIEQFMYGNGLAQRKILLRGDWYKDACGAMLCRRRDDDSIVALIPGKIMGYTFFDSASGQRKSVNKKNAKLFSEEAFCYYRTFPEGKVTMQELFRFCMGCMSVPDICLILLAFLVMAACGAFISPIHNMIYGSLDTAGAGLVIVPLLGVYTCMLLSRTVMSSINTLLSVRVMQKAKIQLEAAGVHRLLSLPVTFFKDYSPGELYSRVSLISQCPVMVANFVISLLMALLSMIMFAPQMLLYYRKAAVPVLLLLALDALATVIAIIVQSKRYISILKLGSEELGESHAVIAGIQKIKLAGAEKRAFSKWSGIYAKYARLIYHMPLALQLCKTLSACIPVACVFIMYALNTDFSLRTEDFFAFSAAYGCLLGVVLQLTDGRIELAIPPGGNGDLLSPNTDMSSNLVSFPDMAAQIVPMFRMIAPILEAVPEVNHAGEKPEKLNGKIELSNVSFRYSDNQHSVIDRLSLKILPGEYVAVVGPTGSGKSTLVRLLLGFEKPQKGAIYYDGKNINSLNLRFLRKNIGTVIQGDQLFGGSIFSNISACAPDMTMEDAWEVAKTAGIAEDIMAMPMKMHTLISDGGGGISGGQCQRILIARAIATKPKILIFDEATSALDNITQKKVSDALGALNCTRLIIAHRLSTIKQCDRILVLDHGRIIEEGNYETLINRQGFFAELVEKQRLDN